MVKKASLNLGDALVVEAPEKKITEQQKIAKKDKTRTLKKIQVPVYYPELLHEQLHLLIFSERKNKASFQSLVMEGLDLALKKRGLPSVEALSEGSAQIKL